MVLCVALFFLPSFLPSFLFLFLPIAHLIRTMSVIYGIRHNISNRIGIGQKHDKTIKSHAPSTMGCRPILSQINKPLEGCHIHILGFHFSLQHIIAPFTHRTAKQFSHERCQQIKGFTRSIPDLFHIKGFNFGRPMRNKDERSKFLHQILFVFGPQIFSGHGFFFKFQFDLLSLSIHALHLVAQILLHHLNGIFMFDSFERFR
mmetsp:Transcript_20540/g.30442  ORF Transcript_20540/g.30442 Transcript_20540/m.30442 type:complete len:203 (-) Transcript_20540:296-904(-)